MGATGTARSCWASSTQTIGVDPGSSRTRATEPRLGRHIQDERRPGRLCSMDRLPARRDRYDPRPAPRRTQRLRGHLPGAHPPRRTGIAELIFGSAAGADRTRAKRPCEARPNLDEQSPRHRRGAAHLAKRPPPLERSRKAADGRWVAIQERCGFANVHSQQPEHGRHHQRDERERRD